MSDESRESNEKKEPESAASGGRAVSDQAANGGAPLLSKRWPWIVAFVVVAIAWLSTWVSIETPARDNRPDGGAEDIEALASRADLNVLFVLIDTLRADHLGSYGYARDTSPALDGLAARGVRFGDHLAQSSWTKCSMASLWTGLYPARNGITRFDHVLPEQARLPAEIFREAGYRTAAVYRNGWVSPYFGFSQGFEVYSLPATRPLPANLHKKNPTMKLGGTDDDVVEAADEFLRLHGHEPWFLYLHFMDVHEYLYDEQSAVFGSNYVDVYDQSILRENYVLDLLFTRLAERDLLDKTLIVIGSDHGEAFGERGFEGHARQVYGETTQVPLYISFPFKLPGVVLDTPTSNVDVWPTVLDLVGLPSLGETDGRSVVPELVAAARGEPSEVDRPAITFLDRNWGKRMEGSLPTLSIRDRTSRYLYWQKTDGSLEREELYDREADPAEASDVAKAQPERVAGLRKRVAEYLEGQPAWGETERLEIDEMELNQLRALGYQIP